MKTRSLAVLAAVAVPVAVTATHAPTGHRQSRIASEAASLDTTLLVRRQTKTTGCTLDALPDRACSPGAIDTKRTSAVICARTFHTSDVRSVPDRVKHQIEAAYGLEPKRYGKTLEIDHIVSLELGGSNDVANLYPELAPGFHAKDELENRLHRLVCAGSMTLHSAQRHIAANWIALYQRVFGKEPATSGSMRPKP